MTSRPFEPQNVEHVIGDAALPAPYAGRFAVEDDVVDWQPRDRRDD